jgi:hypothetical protein
MANDIKKPKIAANIPKIRLPENEYLNNSPEAMDLLKNSLKKALTINPVTAAITGAKGMQHIKKIAIAITSMNIT